MSATNRRLQFLSMLAAALLVAGPGWAQTTRPATTQPATTRAAVGAPATWAHGLLAGPVVDEEARGPAPGGFGGGDDRGRAVSVPPRRWFEVLREQDLTREQERSVGAILREFQGVMREFRREYGEEMRGLATAVRTARRAGERPDEGSLRRLEELQAKQPSAGSYQERLWNLLTPGQQESFMAQLESMREAMLAERLAERQREIDSMMQQRDESLAAGDGAARRDGGDERLRRRLRFLRSRQATGGVGAPATPQERRFTFEEDDDEDAGSTRDG